MFHLLFLKIRMKPTEQNLSVSYLFRFTSAIFFLRHIHYTVQEGPNLLSLHDQSGGSDCTVLSCGTLHYAEFTFTVEPILSGQ